MTEIYTEFSREASHERAPLLIANMADEQLGLTQCGQKPRASASESVRRHAPSPSRFRLLASVLLLMIEQPLAPGDLVDHAKLQREIKTPICLDESIVSLADARHASELGSCRIINIKLGRVGGHTEVRLIQAYAVDHCLPVWCGGMLEAGIGWAHNIALSTLPGFTLPGDVSASARYWEEDII